MMARTYDDTALQRHIQAMRTMLSPNEQVQILTAVGRTMGVAAEASIPEMPAPSGKPRPAVYTRTGADGRVFLSKWKSQKQQGYYFWALGTGQLNVPYRRTGLLQNSISSQVVEVSPERVVVAIGTNAKSAPWVIDEARQTRYHQGTWWALQPVIRRAAGSINQAVAQTLVSEVRRRIPG